MCSEGLRERYVNPYTDFAFKLLFGTDLNKDSYWLLECLVRWQAGH